ncbi:EAL domain-containing protein [Halomonas sp. NO4]|uniref:putative bifunctional diguanylate cyclase/phosphodiesterase n=1 Tax=Halomonas sp. NO4 TaxID=2484813 RepID=UPI0013D7BDB3|nr:EAL domain-containing protein [Halomonas sp. NO4]
MQWQRRNRQHRIKVLGLIAGLFLVAALASAFTVAAVQLQAATAAYVSGQSAWSRAQLDAVYHLDAYAESGRPEELARARDALAVPLGDRQARLAMERDPFDEAAAREGMRQGLNHPDDFGRMIWLYRHFADFPVFRQPVSVWRESDAHILALAELADRLEAEWTGEAPSARTLVRLRTRLEALNAQLDPLTEAFRRAMTDAARVVARLLTIASVVFLLTLALVAWLLGWRLTRVITAAERKFRVTFEQAAVGMAQVDRAGFLIDVNQSLCEILGYPKRALLGRRYWDLVHVEDREIGRAQREQIRAGTLDSYTIEHRLMCRHGSTVWGKLTVSSMRDDPDYSPRYVAILEDVSESRRLSVELSHQANHDALTGLPNRRAFERSLAETLRQARTEGSAHALGFIDLDQFKIINDTAGHAAGDQLLRQVTELLSHQLREGDLLARLGGDEFAVILEDCDLPRARQVTEKLRSALENASFVWENATFRPGCSIGVVPITAASVDADSLQRTADIACYLAKEQGRNRVYVLHEDDQQMAQQRGEMEWLNRIRQALDERRLFLEAQRLERLDAPHRLRYEVLVRLTDEHGQVVPPGAFLPAAERFGAAHQIDRWVIEEVCAQLAAHPRHLARLEACHINLSGRSFDKADFGDFVVATLERHALPAEKLCFEITETAAVRNLTDVTAFMERLGERGCTFALDDFGAGLSSFGYLRRLPVECIKIDGAFVRHIVSDDTDLAMVRAINEIGQTLNKTIVAEFVESQEALALLREMGVHYVQGYGVHRPCRFETLLADRRFERVR